MRMPLTKHESHQNQTKYFAVHILDLIFNHKRSRIDIIHLNNPEHVLGFLWLMELHNTTNIRALQKEH